MRLVFCGTPEFAVPTLEAVLAAGHDVALVLTQPDRPSGRGMQLVSPPVKIAALKAGLEVTQPEKIKNNLDLREKLEAIAPEVIIVVAYGRLIPAWMLELARFGCINVHGSLLPKYRGAAPIQWAIARGETVTGVTTMLLDEGLDTGPMLLRRELAVEPNATAANMYPPLAQMGAGLLIETLEGLAAGTIVPEPQQHELSTLAPMLTRDDGRIDFTRPAREIYNRWRGFYPWPGAWTTLDGKKFTVTRMALPNQNTSPFALDPGDLYTEDGRLYACCVFNNLVELVEVQLEGKRSMSAADFMRGRTAALEVRLGDAGA